MEFLQHLPIEAVITLQVLQNTFFVTAIILVIILFAMIIWIVKWYKKPVHGKALVRTGFGGTAVTFDRGFFIIPVLHRLEVMDITLKTVTISRTNIEGLICKDNMRADIKVTFFVRVNNTMDDVKKVAFAIGCERASHQETLVTLFDAKFSEALKTVGKKFDFVELYTDRSEFKHEILQVIGTDLNGYYLDDCAIDYLEQTPLDVLKQDNILDAEGIKKITELTSIQIIMANNIEREKEKTITKQNVEAQETILELNKQLAETEQKQRREIENIKDREQTEILRVKQEQRLIAEQARIATEEQLQISEQNKERQVLVASKSKDRTMAVETERVERDRQLEVNERERIVTIAQIEKEKAVEEEKKKIQEFIRERVVVEKAVVIEEEKIKDTKAYAQADRDKQVAITRAEMLAQQGLVKLIKDADAAKQAAEHQTKQQIIEATAHLEAASKEAEATKILAEAKASEEAVLGKSEAQVMEAKAMAARKQGETEASIIEVKAVAEAKAIDVKSKAEADAKSRIGTAEANIINQKGMAEVGVIKERGLTEASVEKEKGIAGVMVQKEAGLTEATIISAKAKAEEEKGLVEAKVIQAKYNADAEGILKKAESMKQLDLVGKEHEEFKLRLQKDKDVELAQINIQKDIAQAQATVIAEAVKSAKIDIVGGETMFFEQIIGSITKGKSVDAFINSSKALSQLKDSLLDTTDGSDFAAKLKQLVTSIGVSTNDIKNLSIAKLLHNLSQRTNDEKTRSMIEQLLDFAVNKGIADRKVDGLGL